MKFIITPANYDDLRRCEELAVRTNQLNTTGYTYSFEELDQFRQSPRHQLLIAELEDKYGNYGKIGLALLECEEKHWTLKLLLMSCRVMSRGVGSVLMNHISNMAVQSGVALRSEFVQTAYNRMMYVTFKFAGYKEIDIQGDRVVFENSIERIQPFPEYIQVTINAS
ncbi:hypothetical protein D3C78_1487130 [compost metagenome]